MRKFYTCKYDRAFKEVFMNEKNKEIIMLDLPLEELKSLSKNDRMVAKYMSELKKVNEDPEFFEFMSAEEDNRKIESSIQREMTEKGLEQAQKQIIESMLKNGLDAETISRYTDIDMETIKKYQDK